MEILEKENILINQPVMMKDEAIKRAADLLVERGYVTENYYSLMQQREKECTTYIGNGIAIPHGISKSEKDILNSGIVVLQFKEGISYNQETVYLMLGIAGKNNEHLDILANIACLLDSQKNVERALACNTPDEMYELLMPLNKMEG